MHDLIAVNQQIFRPLQGALLLHKLKQQDDILLRAEIHHVLFQ